MVNLNKDLDNKIVVNNVEIDLIKMRDDINKKIDYSTIFGIAGVFLGLVSFYLNSLIMAPINEFRVELNSFKTELISFESRFDKRFEQIDKRFELMDKKFEQIDKRFEQIDKRFEQIDKKFDLIEQHWQESNRRTDQLYLHMVELTSK